MFRKAILLLTATITLLFAGNAATLAEAGQANPAPHSIPVLMYHNFSENPFELSDITVSPDRFREDMQALIDNGYTPIFFQDYLDAMNGKIELPAKPIFITIDDGYYSVYRYAYPILKELHLKATVSIIGWSVGRTTNKDNKTPIFAHFSWKEAKEMYDSGVIDIQHHTWDLHNEMGRNNKGVMKQPGESDAAYLKRLKADFMKLKTEIESNIGNKVIVFTYPYGSYNATAEKALKQWGIQFTLTMDDGISDLSQSRYLLKRINVSQRMTSTDLIQKIDKPAAGEQPAASIFPAFRLAEHPAQSSVFP